VEVDVDEDEATTQLYAQYVPHSFRQPGASPATLSEPVNLSIVRPPPLDGDEVDARLLATGALHVAQAEFVAYAAQRWSKRAADGTRLGILTADGTGAGKGRLIAASIVNHVLNVTGAGPTPKEARRHIWVSVNPTLFQDASRDWRAVKAAKLTGGLDLLQTPHIDYNTRLLLEDGVLFITYAFLRSRCPKRANGARPRFATRLEQILDWLTRGGAVKGDVFHGVAAFDETHLCKNLAPASGAKSSLTGLAVDALQSRLPGACVLYASATFASHVRQLGVYTRLGLWGPGTAFETFQCFYKRLSGLGQPAIELLACSLKLNGAMLARTVSYAGCTFETAPADWTAAQAALHDACASWWRGLFSLPFFDAEEGGGATPHDRAYVAGAQLRFSRGLALQFKVPRVLDLVREALDADHAPVISLLCTDQAATDRAVAAKKRDDDDDDDDEDDADAGALADTCAAALARVAAAAGEDDDGVAELRARLKDIALPTVAAIDLLHDGVRALGHEMVELTGRSHMQVLRADGARDRVKKPDNVALQQRFASGQARCALISASAACGISLHAAPNIANQRRRVGVLAQLSYSADVSMQLLGRVNRTSQVCSPSYKLLVGPADARFAGTLSKRLAQLSATTQATGESHCGTNGLDMGVGAMLCGPHGAHGARAMHQALSNERLPDDLVDVPGIETFGSWVGHAREQLKATGWAPKDDNAKVVQLLNRSMILDHAIMLNVQRLHEATTSAAVFRAKAGGAFHTDRVATIETGPRVRVHDTVETEGGARALLIKTHTELTLTDAVDKQKLLEERDIEAHFYKSKDDTARKIAHPPCAYAVLAHMSTTDPNTMIVTRPHGKISLMLRGDFNTRYTRATADNVGFAKLWKDEHDDGVRLGKSVTGRVFFDLPNLFEEWNTMFSRYENRTAMRTTRATIDGVRTIGVSVSEHALAGIRVRMQHQLAETHGLEGASEGGGEPAATWPSAPTWQSARDRLRAVLANGSAADDGAAANVAIVVDTDGVAHVQGA
jgi:hypothetical protein